MTLAAIKKLLPTLETITFRLENGTFVPAHFHITEVGMIHKHFIDCGGTIHTETVANFQLWNADDRTHRLEPQKLLHIISLSQEKLNLPDLSIEVEYQTDTIGKYGLDFDGKHFLLTSKNTTCLAGEACGVPVQKQKLNLTALPVSTGCAPGSGCC